MRSRLRVLGLAASGVLALAQVKRPAPTHPPSDPSRALEAHVAVPPRVGALLERACADCHSHRTRWPWYSRVAPASWLVVEHVDHGRRHLNFSDWTAGGPERAKEPLRAICTEATRGRMPPRSFVLLHWGARLSDAEVRELCEWSAAAAPPGPRGG